LVSMWMKAKNCLKMHGNGQKVAGKGPKLLEKQQYQPKLTFYVTTITPKNDGALVYCFNSLKCAIHRSLGHLKHTYNGERAIVNERSKTF
jgi:hypothetical protein